MSEEIYATMVMENTWLLGMDHGWGNGYVAVPPGHPWHGLGYDDIDVDVHGGLTYAADHRPRGPKDGFWWIGFDTCYCMDNALSRPESFVRAETMRLKAQAIKAAELKKISGGKAR